MDGAERIEHNATNKFNEGQYNNSWEKQLKTGGRGK